MDILFQMPKGIENTDQSKFNSSFELGGSKLVVDLDRP